MSDQADNALRYAQQCLNITPQDESFCLGYAYESLARAEALAGDSEQAKAYLAQAWQQAKAVTDSEDKKLLTDDLKSLE